MKPKNRPLASLICVSLLGSAALSHAGILWQLDFNSYADGNIENQAVGQPGFPGNWFDGAATVTSGVVTSGNSKAEMNQTFSAAVGATGTLWLSFDWGHNNSGDHVDTYGGLTFFESNYPTLTEKGLIGNTWNNPNWNTTSESNTGMKTGVAKITLSNSGDDTVELWVGPTGSTVDVTGPSMATLSMELSNVNCVRVNGGNSQTFDNLVIGTSAADVDAYDGPPATPTSGTWTNTDGGTWGTEGNWLSNIVAIGSDSTADFSTLNITADTTVTLDSARTIGNLVFGDTDTSSAAGWTLTNNSVPANTLTLADTTPTITVNALGTAKTVAISAAVGGSAGLTKAGDGTLTLSAANTYTGLTTVSAGTLQLQGGAFSTTARTYSIASLAVLNLDGNTGVATGTTTLDGTGTLRITGGAFANETPNEPKGDGRDISMELDPGAVIDVQSGASMYNGGWQNITWTNNLADLNADGSFDLAEGQNVFVGALTGAGSIGGATFVGGDVGGPQKLTVGVGGVALDSSTFSGTVSGGIGFTKTGAGTQTLSGTNTYSGDTLVEAGTLSIPSTGSLRFFPTTDGQSNLLSGTVDATLSYLGTLDLDLSAANITDGNLWTLVDVGSFSVATLEPAAVTSTLGSFDETSPGTWELSVSGVKWTFDEAFGELTVEVTATPYELWANSFDPAIGLPAEDDDNDGVTNFEEFAFGLLPNSGASVNPIAAQLDKTTEKFSYTRRSTSGLAYSVWFSENLADWTEDTAATEGTPVPSGDNETVEVTLSTLPGNPLPAKLFIQVRAE